jgi:hypothetical protein
MRISICNICLSSFFLFIYPNSPISGEIIPNRSANSPYSGSSGGSGGFSSQPSSSISKPMEPLKPKSQTTSVTPLPPLPPPPALVPGVVTPTYFHPGALIRLDGHWEGGDHLFNLPNNIGVFVEIIRPSEDKLKINESEIQKIVENIFLSTGVTPTTLSTLDQPPLPFFQIQILLYPISRGYAASCNGRLFESVNLRRINFDPGMAFQAITWEKQSLIVAPTETMTSQLEAEVSNIGQAFISRFPAQVRR